MSKREEDFHNKAEKYANECGGTTQEKCAIITDYYAGCEHGYQYAVDKVCDILNHYCNRSGVHPSWRVDIINHIRKAMED